MNWKALGQKFLHAIVPAAGAAIAMAVPLFGAVPLAVILKTAGAAFIAYMVKPARPAVPATGDVPIPEEKKKPGAV